MARHFDREIAQARATQATAGQRAEQPEMMSGIKIDSFLRGFGLNAAQVHRIYERWINDQTTAYRQGYDDGYETATR